MLHTADKLNRDESRRKIVSDNMAQHLKNIHAAKRMHLTNADDEEVLNDDIYDVRNEESDD